MVNHINSNSKAGTLPRVSGASLAMFHVEHVNVNVEGADAPEETPVKNAVLAVVASPKVATSNIFRMMSACLDTIKAESVSVMRLVLDTAPNLRGWYDRRAEKSPVLLAPIVTDWTADGSNAPRVRNSLLWGGTVNALLILGVVDTKTAFYVVRDALRRGVKVVQHMGDETPARLCVEAVDIMTAPGLEYQTTTLQPAMAAEPETEYWARMATERKARKEARQDAKK